jgi:hypothetical protein
MCSPVFPDRVIGESAPFMGGGWSERRDDVSVLKNKRALSELEFFHNATELRREITLLLLRDFGVKDKVRTVKSLYGISNMEPEDTKKIQEMVEKYGMCGSIVEEYPMWLIDKMRNNVLNICHSMIMNITQANTIYPMSEEEFHDRRNFQNHAIGNCEQLLQEMQYIISIIPVDAQKYMRYVDMIEKEIALLKGWRKSDNKILKRIRESKK